MSILKKIFGFNSKKTTDEFEITGIADTARTKKNYTIEEMEAEFERNSVHIFNWC